MRQDFFKYVCYVMESHPEIYIVCGDLGFGILDPIKDKYPDRFINTGASEQLMMDIAVGLAYSGRIPICYTITPFFLRGFETIRTYINHEKLKVIMTGSGRDEDYTVHDGYSHDAKDIQKIFNTQENILQYYPDTLDEATNSFNNALTYNGPVFISLKR